MVHVTEGGLSQAQQSAYHSDGFLQPINLCSLETVGSLRDAVDDHLGGRHETELYELTDPVQVRRVTNDDRNEFQYVEQASERPRTFPFLFNVWRHDDRFAEVAFSREIGEMARQLLDCEEVLLMEDNVVTKLPGSKSIPWHQDLSYWPVEQSTVVTVWIALGKVDHRNGAMAVVPGSHRTEEHLPVSFGDASTYMGEHRPDTPTLTQDPAGDGYEVVLYNLEAGQGGFHHPLVWHASTPNTTTKPRHAYVVRYIASGSRWLGSERIPYGDIGCRPGQPVTAAHLPSVARL